jgi:hypothetical protein
VQLSSNAKGIAQKRRMTQENAMAALANWR